MRLSVLVAAVAYLLGGISAIILLTLSKSTLGLFLPVLFDGEIGREVQREFTLQTDMTSNSSTFFITNAMRPYLDTSMSAGVQREISDSLTNASKFHKQESSHLNSTSRVFDCILFHQELAMIYFRMHELDHVVDFFVVVEGSFSFSGMRKRKLFKENRYLFARFESKIIYVENNERPATKNAWYTEDYNRDYLARGLPSNIHDDDIILMHDIDEVPNPSLVQLLKQRPDYILTEPCVFPMDFYYTSLNFMPFQYVWRFGGAISGRYFRDNRGKQPFGSMFVRPRKGIKGPQRGFVRDCLGSTSCGQKVSHPYTCKGGWHMSYFMSTKQARSKLAHFSHKEMNTKETIDTMLTARRSSENGGDLFGRNLPQRNGTFLKPKFYQLLEVCLEDPKFDLTVTI